MLNRREFLKNSTALMLGSLALPKLINADMFLESAYHVKKVGLQLFTFFPNFDKDVAGNLKKIAEIGYKEIESSFSLKGDFYGMKAKEFAKMVNDAGMSWTSHHVMGAPFKPPKDMDMSKYPAISKMPKMNNLRDNAQEILDQAGEGGFKYLVCSSIPITTATEVKEAVVILNKSGEAANKAGKIFCYHNHDKEFADVEGIKPYDVFMSQISADVMKCELDLAWVSKAGVNPVDLFTKYPKRFPLWHVKDFDKDFKNLMPVGSGVIDFKTIFSHAKLAGLKHPFVEHDMPKDAIASITSSINYLKQTIK